MKKRTLKRPKGYDDSPITAAEWKTARPLRDVFPDLAEFSRRRRARKGEAKKQGVYVRFSPRVLSYFKSKGPGWQTRMDRALLAFIEAAE
jgi:uncharacterized protein (DUF4415 family)